MKFSGRSPGSAGKLTTKRLVSLPPLAARNRAFRTGSDERPTHTKATLYRPLPRPLGRCISSQRTLFAQVNLAQVVHRIDIFYSDLGLALLIFLNEIERLFRFCSVHVSKAVLA
jgi:hypothetical protein